MILPGIGPMPHLQRSLKLATAVWGPLFETDVDQKPYNLGNISRLKTAIIFSSTLHMLAFTSFPDTETHRSNLATSIIMRILHT